MGLEEELVWYDEQAKQDETCQRLQAIPGVGEVVTSLLKSWMGNGRQLRQLVPRQNSTDGRAFLLGISSKRGAPYVRAQQVHVAQAVVARADKKTDRLSR